MRVRRARSGSFPVWALPVSGDVVCLWVVTPVGVADLDLVPEDAKPVLRFRRRLIRRAQRLSLFVYEAPGFRSGQACRLAFSVKGQARTETTSAAALADWGAPLVASVVRLLLEGLATLAPPLPTTGLARFLGLVSSWAAACRFRGAIGDVDVALFDVAAGGAEAPRALFAVEERAVSLFDATVVPVGGRCCLMATGRFPGTLYFDTGHDLVELSVPVAATGDVPAWLMSLGRSDRDSVLDGLAPMGLGRSPGALAGLEAAVDPASAAGGSGDGWQTACVVRGGRTLHAVLEGPAAPPDADPVVRIADLRAREIALDNRWQLASGDRRILVCRAVADEPLAHGPVRLTVESGGRVQAGWVRPVPAESEAARRALRAVLPWQRADRDLLDELFVPVAATAREPSLPPEIELVPRRVPVAAGDPLVVCFHEAGLAEFQRTLIGIALSSAGAGPSLRVVFRESARAADVSAVAELCAQYAMPAGAVFLAKDDPANPGCGWRDGDDRFAAAVLMRSGSVPRRGDWWQALAAAALDRPSAVWWPGEGGLTTSSVAARGGLVAALGRDARETLGPGAAAFATFEGWVVHACLTAARDGVLHEHESLRFFSPALGDLSVLAEARLDDAVIAFVEERARSRGGPGKVHPFRQRAGGER